MLNSMMRRTVFPTLLFSVFLLSLTRVSAYEVTLQGGPRMDIPVAWVLSTEDPSVPAWYAPDRGAAAEVMLWAPGTWAEMQAFVDEIRPEGAEGDVMAFPMWNGEAALADWTFPTASGVFRGWFLLVRGHGPDVLISAITAAEQFNDRQPFLLSVLDSYSPGDEVRLQPGAVSRFLEFTGTGEPYRVSSVFEEQSLIWLHDPAAASASQDVIEREALVLSAYGGVPTLFYEAWIRYYRLIYRDSYERLSSLADALADGPLPIEEVSPEEAAKRLLDWLQGFSYGSTDGFSDLLAPSTACASGTGDCDSLALALIILMDGYGVDGRILISYQAAHAVAALDLPGKGLRYSEGEDSWLVAELTSRLPLGVLPERLDGVDDWFSIDFDQKNGIQ
jgi:hypothetical protein